MTINSRSAARRFFKVINLFVRIFWSFFSLKFKALWHKPGWKDTRREELYFLEARRFRNTAVEMGGLLIKLGQFLSTRVDILPQSATRELAGLQDEVPAVAFQDIAALLVNEFNMPLHEVYAHMDETPLASASLGQVHQAELPGGEIVAVKVLRPGIERLIDIDLRAMRRVIGGLKLLTDWQKWVDFDAIYEEFAVTLREELDYLQEGKNAETIAQNSAADPDLIVPRIHWDYTRRRVLTMEFMQGMKVTDYQSLEKAGINRSRLAQKLLEIYVKQILVDGFFHADPHPGNLFIDAEGRIIMIDFGMMGTISPDLRNTLIQMVLAMVAREHHKVVFYLKQVGFVRRDADDEILARAVGLFLEQTLGEGLKSFDQDVMILLDDLEKLLYEQPFQIPARFTFLGRALGTLYGICIGLDSKISFLDAGKPYLKQFMPKQARPSQIIKEKGAALGTALVEVPPLLEKTLRRAEQGQLEVKIPLKNVEAALMQNAQASYAIAWGIVLGSSLLGTVYLYVHHFTVAARWGGAASVIFFLILLAKTRTRQRSRMPRHPEGIPKGRY